MLVLARRALTDLGSDPDRLRAFTLDLGDGEDGRQAGSVVRALGVEGIWESSSSLVSETSISNERF